MNLKDLQAEIEDMPSGSVALPTGDILALLRLAIAVQAEYAATTIETLEEAREEKNKAFAALEAL